MPRLQTLATLLLATSLTGCPQAAEPPAKAAPNQHLASADDKRVVADTSDLYAAEQGAPTKTVTPKSPGTGRPDETNGKCRLYAPELPDPGCCERDLGFDVETVKEACGLKLYLGESFHATCGYHFLEDATATGEPAKWFRLSPIRGATPREAAEAHDQYTRQISKDPAFKSVPIPGMVGAYWSSQDDLHWAFLPGWSTVRQFTWHDGACSEEGIRKILEQLINAPEVPVGTVRRALLPGGEPTPAATPVTPVTPVTSSSPPAAVAG